jgi:hypothetical protein
MNFTFTWIMDKLGYMPKIDMQIGKLIDLPVEEKKKRPQIKKATTRKAPAKKAK